MIARERLEQLIEKGAEIWHLCGRKDIRKTNARDIPTHYRLNNFKDWELYKEYYFETKEEAEFSLEFQNITRTETLNLPTLEELNKKVDTIPNMFLQIAKCSEFILFLQTDKTLNNSQIILRGNDDTYNWGLTKENYLEACKIAKKLFLGEE